MQKILILDDEEQILKSLKRSLFDGPYEIIVTTSIDEAFALIEREKIHLIISDMKMPGMNGYEFLKQVKERKPEIIRVILSGYSDEKVVLQALQENVVAQYFYKPWKTEELQTNILGLLRTQELIEKAQEKSLLQFSFDMLREKKSLLRLLDLIESPDASFDDIMEELSKNKEAETLFLSFIKNAFPNINSCSLRDCSEILDKTNVRFILLAMTMFQCEGSVKEHHEFVQMQREFAFLTNRIFMLIYKNYLHENIEKDVLLAGLLHNIGLIFLACKMSDTYVEQIDEAICSSDSIENREIQLYGVTHSMIGGYILSRMEFPFSYIETALYHHSPIQSDVANRKLVCAVHLSMCIAGSIIKPGYSQLKIDERVYGVLNISKANVEEIIAMLKP